MSITIQEPRIAILVEQTDGTLLEYIVQTDNRDRVRWDLIRERKKWPALGEASSLWMTVMGWNALRRSGVDVGDDPIAFLDKCAGVYIVDENGDLVTKGTGTAPVDPTPPGADTGS